MWNLEEYLVKKLAKDDARVKVKTLKIIKHVCEQGKPEFRRAMARRADQVKHCQQFRGEVHPTRGDAPNQEVRREAEACLKALFASDTSASAPAAHMSKIQGFGNNESGAGTNPANFNSFASQNGFGPSSSSQNNNSTGFSSSNGGGMSGGRSQMQGFGNPRFAHVNNNSMAAAEDPMDQV